MASPELLIFDCDGVLVDSEIIANRILSERLTALGYAVTTEQCLARFVGYSTAKIIAEVTSSGIDLPDDFEPFLKRNDEDLFAAELKAIPGVADVLAQLPHKKCVASSGAPDKIRRNLTTTHLIDYFNSHLYSAHMVKNAKPAPDLFLHAAKQFNVDPGNCLVIEDTALGIQAAQAAGMPVLGFAGGSHCNDAYRARLVTTGIETIFSDMALLPSLITKRAGA